MKIGEVYIISLFFLGFYFEIIHLLKYKSMLRFILFILLISPSLFFGQKSSYRAKIKDALFFWDDMHQKFVIIDDSVSIHVYNNSTKNWDSEPLLLSSEITFNNFVSDFIPVSRKQKSTLFVHCGGGIVLELKGNRIERIDHSFTHKNQYFGTFFSYKNEPYIFGGYGLFSFKDFVTRFDYNEKEWFKFIIKKTKPRPRRLNISIIEDNKLYVFGGEGEFDEKYTFLNDAWVLDLYNLKWSKLGILNNRIPNSIPFDERSSLSLSFDIQHYFATNERIYRFFPSKNKVRIYTNQIHSKVRNIVEKGPHFLIKYRKQFSDKVEFLVVDSNYFFTKLVHDDHFIYKSESKSKNQVFIFISFIILVLIFSFAFLRRRIIKNTALISTYERLVLTEAERDLLSLFISNKDKGIEIHQINDLLIFGDPSMETLKKRREQLLKVVKFKLSKHFNIELNEVFLEERMSTDKRMKIMFLNPLIYEHLKNNSPL